MNSDIRRNYVYVYDCRQVLLQKVSQRSTVSLNLWLNILGNILVMLGGYNCVAFVNLKTQKICVFAAGSRKKHRQHLFHMD